VSALKLNSRIDEKCFVCSAYLFVPVVKTANLKISEARLQGNGKLKKEYVANALTR
jgi:hypothetical protein